MLDSRKLERMKRSPHIGVDEAGRGCLAGPVVAGAVLALPNFDFAERLPGLADSKALSEPRREKLRAEILKSGLAWGLGFSWAAEIDEVNVLNATLRAMARAVCALYGRFGRPAPECTLYIDGSQKLSLPHWQAGQGKADFPLPKQTALVRGDGLMPAISAASILAKTQRDRLMRALERRHPGYALAGHKGYGTREHLEALRRLGPCPLHRLSFAGVEKPPEDQFPLF